MQNTQAGAGEDPSAVARRECRAELSCAFHVGVSPAERAATLEEIDRKQVNLIIASD